MATASMVCALVGLLFFGIVLGPIALILGIVALSQINGSGGMQGGKGMAITGIVVGAADILFFFIVLSALSDSGGF